MTASAAIDLDLVSGAETMVRMLQLQGATHRFGLCGDTSLPFHDALNRLHHGSRVAEAFAVEAWRMDEPAALRGALAAALNHDGPALVDVVYQPLHEAHAPVSECVV